MFHQRLYAGTEPSCVWRQARGPSCTWQCPVALPLLQSLAAFGFSCLEGLLLSVWLEPRTALYLMSSEKVYFSTRYYVPGLGWVWLCLKKELSLKGRTTCSSWEWSRELDLTWNVALAVLFSPLFQLIAGKLGFFFVGFFLFLFFFVAPLCCAKCSVFMPKGKRDASSWKQVVCRHKV